MYHEHASASRVPDEPLERARQVIVSRSEPARASGGAAKDGQLGVHSRGEQRALIGGLLCRHGRRIGGEAGEPLLCTRRHDGEREQCEARDRERHPKRRSCQARRGDGACDGGEEGDGEVTYPRGGEPSARRQNADGHRARRDQAAPARGWQRSLE
jgi:hypothetical protein